MTAPTPLPPSLTDALDAKCVECGVPLRVYAERRRCSDKFCPQPDRQLLTPEPARDAE